MEDKNEITHAHIVERLEVLEDKLEPLIQTLQDIAVLGRFAGIVSRSVLWVAGLVVAVLAAWSALKGVV